MIKFLPGIQNMKKFIFEFGRILIGKVGLISIFRCFKFLIILQLFNITYIVYLCFAAVFFFLFVFRVNTEKYVNNDLKIEIKRERERDENHINCSEIVVDG